MEDMNGSTAHVNLTHFASGAVSWELYVTYKTGAVVCVEMGRGRNVDDALDSANRAWKNIAITKKERLPL